MALLVALIVVPLSYALENTVDRGSTALGDDGDRIGRPDEGYTVEAVPTTVYAGSSTTAAPVDTIVASAGVVGQATLQNSQRWTATVIVTLVDGNGDPVAGATVSGEWTDYGGAKQDTQCVTDAAGRCTVTQWALDTGGAAETVYTLIDAVGDGVSIDPAVVGTAISVAKPA